MKAAILVSALSLVAFTTNASTPDSTTTSTGVMDTGTTNTNTGVTNTGTNNSTTDTGTTNTGVSNTGTTTTTGTPTSTGVTGTGTGTSTGTGTTTTVPTDTGTSTTTSGKDASTTLPGSYQCQRVDGANNSHNYPLTITKTGDTYTFQWDDDKGNPVLYGTGAIHPDMTNVVATTFWDPKNSETQGVEIFEVKSDGSLKSNWVLQTNDNIGSETCKRK